MNFVNTLNQFCIILTHRHGACVAIFTNKKSEILNQTYADLIENVYLQNKISIQQIENIEYIHENDVFIVARALGKTAENLSNLYQFVCQKFSVSHLDNIVMGIGPGSFTGLRLGCAFANGLNLSASSHLFAIKTLLRSELLEYTKTKIDSLSLSKSQNTLVLDSLKHEFGELRESDQTSGFITFFDMFYAYIQIQNNDFTACSTLIPHYGREPTPVLNLRKE